MEKRKTKKAAPRATAAATATQAVSRYRRFQRILDQAAGKSEADYGGLGARVWNTRKLPELFNATMKGFRLIAPENEPVHSRGSWNKAAAGAGSRAARSGLVQGLRGLPPFDGSRLPRLMWGGSAVSEEDIEFIAGWINDGCPAGDLGQPLESLTVTDAPITITREGYALYDGPPNRYKYQQGELKQRMNLDCLGPDQLEELRCAFRELYELNNWPRDVRSYNNLALIHQNHCQHGWERFLPWHRIYLYEFEQMLQDMCPGVTMPYWDFTMPGYCPEHPEKGQIIPESFKAFLTDESIAFLEKDDPKLPVEAGKALRKGMVKLGKTYPSPTKFFDAVAEMTDKKYTVGNHRDRFIDALLAANSLWYPLRYPGEYKGGTINQVIHYHYPTAGDMKQILSLRTFRDFGGGSFYDDSFGFLDQNPHNTMHIWTGGLNINAAATPVVEGYQLELSNNPAKQRNRSVRVAGRRFHSLDDLCSQPDNGDMLSNLTASYDPIFWPIHANIDRTWHEWQQLNPHSLPQDLDAVLTPWSYTIADTLDMARFGYEYVKCAFVIPVGLSTPVGRFISHPIAIPAPVRASFRQAEVRLHRVPHLPRSCFIRVFLTLPEANRSPPFQTPPHP